MNDPNFDAYWSAIDDELARYPGAPELEHSPLRQTDYATVYHLKLTSIGPYRLFGYLSIPAGDGPFPGLYLTPRYGSVNHVPHPDDRKRYVVLQLMHRGQRLADKPFSAPYPGLLTMGIDDPLTSIYRGIAADCLRGAEFLLAHPAVDRARVGIRGDDLAIVTAARRPGFTAADFSGFLFYRLMEARKRTSDYPLEEVNDYLRAHPEREEAVARTVALFDPATHAPRVTARAMLANGDPGSMTAPDWLAPLTGALGGGFEHYALTHEGATDHDWLDAWLAAQLGVPPMPRLWRIEA